MPNTYPLSPVNASSPAPILAKPPCCAWSPPASVNATSSGTEMPAHLSFAGVSSSGAEVVSVPAPCAYSHGPISQPSVPVCQASLARGSRPAAVPLAFAVNVMMRQAPSTRSVRR